MGDSIQTLLCYVKELYGFSKYKLLLTMILMVVLGLSEGIGILMLVPFFSLAGILPGLQANSASHLFLEIEKIFQSAGLSLNLPVILAVYSSIILGQSWLQCLQSRAMAELQQGYISFISNRLFRTVAYARWGFLLTKAKSDITHVLTSEIMRVSTGTSFFLQMLAALLIGLIQICIAFMISPHITIMVFCMGIFLFSCLHSFVKKSRQMGLDISNCNRKLFFEVTEHLNGIKEVKSYGLEGTQIRNFALIRQKIEDNFIDFNHIQSQTNMLYKFCAAIFVSVFVYSAIEIFKLNPQEFLLIIIIFARLWPRLSAFQVALQYVVMMLPAFRVVKNLEQQCLMAFDEVPTGSPSEKMMLTKGVDFRKVSFCYDSMKIRYAVNDISFTIPVGSTTAFVGESGSGKSTLVDLLIGVLIPQRGAIFLDDISLNEKLYLWRQSIGYVSQDAFLFHASIRENLRWSCPDAEESAMWEALKLSSAVFVYDLPDQLDTIVGDRGVRLSGGECQRIVLARALLRNPSILILDEATSSLDMENERQIQSAIESLHGKLTIVVIAHRLSTIKNADIIYVMEQGSIVEKGTYSSLNANEKGRFYVLSH